MKEKKELIRKVKFTLFSISAGLIEIGLFTLLNEFTDWGYWACYLIALVASVIWNFTLNREFTFKSTANVPVAMFKVFIFYLIFTPTSTMIGDYLVDNLHWNEYLVTGINMLCNFILEYLYDKNIVFKGKIDTKDNRSKK
ncbi:MAG: GtrA family protein [Bacilli bacterium]|nr:GtrA family protein [Bacilli bacterium]